MEGVGEHGGAGGVGDVHAELVGLVPRAGDHERAPREEGAAGRRAGRAVGVGEDVGLVGLVEADVVEVQRPGGDERGGQHRGADGGDLPGGERVERVGTGGGRRHGGGDHHHTAEDDDGEHSEKWHRCHHHLTAELMGQVESRMRRRAYMHVCVCVGVCVCVVTVPARAPRTVTAERRSLCQRPRMLVAGS
jgi:hypothetical protein